jgi:hypothetical protein
LIFYGIRGVAPLRLLQNIASGLLGGIAFYGGIWTAVEDRQPCATAQCRICCICFLDDRKN